jgi:hypothetical protein
MFGVVEVGVDLSSGDGHLVLPRPESVNGEKKLFFEYTSKFSPEFS